MSETLDEKTTPKYSINEIAEQIVGKRPALKPNELIFDEPAHLGYHCPKCKHEQVLENGEFDERLKWSEYNGFLWCSVCDKDYPCALCEPDTEKAIETYLTCVLNAQDLVRPKECEHKDIHGNDCVRYVAAISKNYCFICDNIVK